MYEKVASHPQDEYPVKVRTWGAQKTVEDLLNMAGTDGWRNYLIIILCMFIHFILPMHLVTYEFLGDTPEHICHVPELQYWTHEQVIQFAIPYRLEKEKYSSCHMYDFNYTLASQRGFKYSIAHLNKTDKIIPCTKRDFLDKTVRSIVTEWDLVCERRWLYSSTQSSTMTGMLIGSLFCGYLSDLYGRRRMVLIASPLYLIIGISICLVPNIASFIILKTLIAIVGVIFGLVPITLLLELCSVKQRSYVGSWCSIPWAIGYMCVAGITYLVRPWRYLQAALTIPVILQLPNYWFLPESPRWLINHGRYEDAIQVLKTFAVSNNKSLPSNDTLVQIMHKIYINNMEGLDVNNDRSRSLKDKLRNTLTNYTAILRIPEFRARILILFFSFFTSSMVYYGISLSSSNYSSNKYLYVLLNGLLEIPAYLVLGPVIAIIGRKKTLFISYMLTGGIILIAMGYQVATTQDSQTVLMILNLIGKFVITCAFTLIFLYTNELFPTKYRSLALGQANGIGRIGSVSSPFINDLLGEITRWAPSAVFGVTSVMAGVMSLYLPETVGRDLQEAIS